MLEDIFLPPSASDNNAEIEGQLRHHSVVGNQAGAPRARTPIVRYEAGLTTAARRVLQQSAAGTPPAAGGGPLPTQRAEPERRRPPCPHGPAQSLFVEVIS